MNKFAPPTWKIFLRFFCRIRAEFWYVCAWCGVGVDFGYDLRLNRKHWSRSSKTSCACLTLDLSTLVPISSRLNIRGRSSGRNSPFESMNPVFVQKFLTLSNHCITTRSFSARKIFFEILWHAFLRIAQRSLNWSYRTLVTVQVRVVPFARGISSFSCNRAKCILNLTQSFPCVIISAYCWLARCWRSGVTNRVPIGLTTGTLSLCHAAPLTSVTTALLSALHIQIWWRARGGRWLWRVYSPKPASPKIEKKSSSSRGRKRWVQLHQTEFNWS